jgi:peptidoglycan/LPS O-acetylase OafA/YrhL
MAVQYPALTSLRFVAALLVFLFHFEPEGSLWQIVASQGHVGVNIFFVLSGFLIALRYADGFAQGRIRLGEYFIRRAARILPLYYAVLFLSLALGRGEPPLSLALLPELTLTQALFGESVNHLVIPTSWSLTVEECFYATAPLLLVGLGWAKARVPRRPMTAAALLLLLVTIVLLAAGAAIWTVLDGRGPGFLRAPEQVVRHTFFGRFYDFATGVLAAGLFAAGGRWREVLARRWPAAAATAVGALLVLVSQWGMFAAGGIDGPHWAQAWSWSALLAPATALVIVALTSAANPAARALGTAPFVYLGKVSYALYLVQLTPLGKGLFYRLIPHTGDITVVFLYAGMTLVSALLYELVEEPARKLVLRVFGLERETAPRAPASVPLRLAAAGVVAAVLAVQCATWAMASLARAAGPVTMAELRAAGLRETDVHQALHNDVRWGRDVLLAGIPRRWREGWRHDLRAPNSVYVFADGSSIPFSRREPPGGHAAAFFRGPRAEHLAVRITAMPRDLTLVREWPPTEARLHLARLAESPRECALVAGICAVVFGLAFVALRRSSPRSAVVIASGLWLAWWIFELHGHGWAIGILVAECAAVLAFAARAATPAADAAAALTALPPTS